MSGFSRKLVEVTLVVVATAIFGPVAVDACEFGAEVPQAIQEATCSITIRASGNAEAATFRWEVTREAAAMIGMVSAAEDGVVASEAFRAETRDIPYEVALGVVESLEEVMELLWAIHGDRFEETGVPIPGSARLLRQREYRERVVGCMGNVGGSGEIAPGAALLPFQRRFLRGAFRPHVDTAVLSGPRGLGKSALAGYILRRAMTPGDPWHTPGSELILLSGSVDQSRLVFRFVRPALELAGGYRFVDSMRSLGITHRASGTRLRVLSSNGKTAMGIVGCPLLVADEPGAFEVNGGTLMHDAIQTAQGKAGSPLRAIYIGTLAPERAGWWHSLVKAGTHGSTYVQALQANPKRWQEWREVLRVNPLAAVSARFRAKLREELEAAKRDTRLKARFLSYRLNIPSVDESSTLLTVDDWERVTARPVPPRVGRPLVGLDLGGGRSWSATVAIWRNGRMEAVACAPGVPDLAAQERRDMVPRGTYESLVQSGNLRVAAGRRVQPVAETVATLRPWNPEIIMCDRFRLPELLDGMGRSTIPVIPRVTRWSEGADDIRGLRRLALDGPLACDERSRSLVAASLAVSEVTSDDAGNQKLIKRGSHNESRDDVAAALCLAAGALARSPSRPRRAYLGMV